MIHDNGAGIDTVAGNQLKLGIERIMPQLQAQPETPLNDTPLTTPQVAQSSPAPLKSYFDLLDKPNVEAKLADDIVAAPGRILQASVAGAKDLYKRVRG